MSPSVAAAYLRDPITVPRQERVEHYRAQAARYQHMAELEERPFVREGLLRSYIEIKGRRRSVLVFSLLAHDVAEGAEAGR